MIIDIPGIILLCIGIYFIYFNFNKIINSVYVTSTIDNRQYLVNNKKDKQQSADTLARLTKNLKKFIECLVEKKNKNKNKYKKEQQQGIDRLNKNFNPDNVIENVGSIEDIFSNSTSYSLNKGKQIVFCIRSKETNKIHNDNLLMFVGLHELGHLMSSSIGHTKEFWANFKFLLQEAIDCGQYQYKNNHFKETPTEYCGVTIANSPIDK